MYIAYIYIWCRATSQPPIPPCSCGHSVPFKKRFHLSPPAPPPSPYPPQPPMPPCSPLFFYLFFPGGPCPPSIPPYAPAVPVLWSSLRYIPIKPIMPSKRQAGVFGQKATMPSSPSPAVVLCGLVSPSFMRLGFPYLSVEPEGPFL